MQPESLTEIFRATVQNYGSGRAIVFADRVLDYATLDQLSNRVAATLMERGVKKGDRVGLYCPNSDSFVGAYLAIIKCGAAVVPVNLL